MKKEDLIPSLLQEDTEQLPKRGGRYISSMEKIIAEKEADSKLALEHLEEKIEKLRRNYHCNCNCDCNCDCDCHDCNC